MNKKAEITITGFMIGIVLVACFAGIFSLFIGALSESYPDTINSSEVSFVNYSKLSNIQDIAETVKNNVTKIDNTNPILQAVDLVGAMFFTGYKMLFAVFSSFEIFEGMVLTAATQAGLPAGYNILTGTILTIAMIVFFMLVVAIIIQRDRL